MCHHLLFGNMISTPSPMFLPAKLALRCCNYWRHWIVCDIFRKNGKSAPMRRALGPYV